MRRSRTGPELTASRNGPWSSGKLRGVGQDHHRCPAGGVKTASDRHLAIHHPWVRPRGRPIAPWLQATVASLSTRPRSSKHTAVPVVGELVQTLSAINTVASQVLGQIAGATLRIPSGVVPPGDTVLSWSRGTPKHQPTHAGGHRGCRGLRSESGLCWLPRPRHGSIGRRLVMPSAANIGGTKCLETNGFAQPDGASRRWSPEPARSLPDKTYHAHS